MKVISIGAESFGSNCYAVISDSHAFVVDPSASVNSIISAVASEGASIDGILLTHGHFDHIISLDTLRKATACEAFIHTDDAEMLTNGRLNAFYTFYGKERVWAPAENLLSDGDEIPLGSEAVRVIHTPGHSQGSVCYLCGDTLISGDTLFADAVGRWDLHGGSSALLSASLQRLRGLDKSLKLCAGHGPDSVLGRALDNAAYYF